MNLAGPGSIDPPRPSRRGLLLGAATIAAAGLTSGCTSVLPDLLLPELDLPEPVLPEPPLPGVMLPEAYFGQITQVDLLAAVELDYGGPDSWLITPGGSVELSGNSVSRMFDGTVGSALDEPFPQGVHAAPGYELILVLLTSGPPAFLDIDAPKTSFVAGTRRHDLAWPFGAWSQEREANARRRIAYLISTPIGADVHLRMHDSGMTASLNLRTGSRLRDRGTLTNELFHRRTEVRVPTGTYTWASSIRTITDGSFRVDTFPWKLTIALDQTYSWCSPWQGRPDRWLTDGKHQWLAVGLGKITMNTVNVGVQMATTFAGAFQLIAGGTTYRADGGKLDFVDDMVGDSSGTIMFKVPVTLPKNLIFVINPAGKPSIKYTDGTVQAKLLKPPPPLRIPITLH